MPAALTFPGVYVEEVPSGVHTIVGVSTADTAFVDFFARGPMDEAVRITSFEDFTRVFGGLDARSEASYAIQQYYLNGGQIAWVVRVASGKPLPASVTLKPDGAPTVEARNEGVWGENLQVAVDLKTRLPNSDAEFNLVVREIVTVRGRKQVGAFEIHRNLTVTPGDPRNAVDVINEASSLIRLRVTPGAKRPSKTADDVTAPEVLGDVDSKAFVAVKTDGAKAASDGDPPDAGTLIAGLDALDRIEPYVFNLLCLPRSAAFTKKEDHVALWGAAETFCERKRAFLLVDPPADKSGTKEDVLKWLDDVSIRHRNAALYFPRLIIADPLNENRPREVGPSGTMAGVYARTDSNRGVWKAPAGTEASLRGASLALKLTDLENGGLNPLGVNVGRSFPVFGNVAWGARTLEGADAQASEWKYIPIRRTALYIEESLYQGLKWVVFEPNDEPLWAQIRLNVGAFMHGLFRQGAFQGRTPREAFLVKCDRDTTTQNDIDRGIVNILVGFAPLKPAEFVVLRIQQLAGQIQA